LTAIAIMAPASASLSQHTHFRTSAPFKITSLNQADAMPPKKPAPPEKGQTRLSFAVAASTAASLTIAATASASSKRPALEPLDPNSAKKPKTDEPKPATESRTLTEFKTITKEAARLALKRLEDGYTDPKSGQSYGRAITNSMGCILPRKKPNRSDNGYVQIAPISTKTRAGTTNGFVSAKPLPQNGHRLVIIAYKS
jgi:hypothetical protein